MLGRPARCQTRERIVSCASLRCVLFLWELGYGIPCVREAILLIYPPWAAGRGLGLLDLFCVYHYWIAIPYLCHEDPCIIFGMRRARSYAHTKHTFSCQARLCARKKPMSPEISSRALEL